MSLFDKIDADKANLKKIFETNDMYMLEDITLYPKNQWKMKWNNKKWQRINKVIEWQKTNNNVDSLLPFDDAKIFQKNFLEAIDMIIEKFSKITWKPRSELFVTMSEKEEWVQSVSLKVDEWLKPLPAAVCTEQPNTPSCTPITFIKNIFLAVAELQPLGVTSSEKKPTLWPKIEEISEAAENLDKANLAFQLAQRWVDYVKSGKDKERVDKELIEAQNNLNAAVLAAKNEPSEGDGNAGRGRLGRGDKLSKSSLTALYKSQYVAFLYTLIDIEELDSFVANNDKDSPIDSKDLGKLIKSCLTMSEIKAIKAVKTWSRIRDKWGTLINGDNNKIMGLMKKCVNPIPDGKLSLEEPQKLIVNNLTKLIVNSVLTWTTAIGVAKELNKAKATNTYIDAVAVSIYTLQTQLLQQYIFNDKSPTDADFWDKMSISNGQIDSKLFDGFIEILKDIPGTQLLKERKTQLFNERYEFKGSKESSTDFCQKHGYISGTTFKKNIGVVTNLTQPATNNFYY